MSTPIKIGYILGSTRSPSNTFGVFKHIESVISSSFPSVTLDVIHLTQSPGHPLPFDLEDTIPAALARYPLSELSSHYTHPAIQDWSATVLKWDAMIILTPQYNWGYPALLKNAIDQLFVEWNAMPAALMTLGGRGGSKVQVAGREMLHGIHAEVVDRKVEVVLPKNYIHGADRVQGDEEWLLQYDEAIKATVNDIIELVNTKKAGVETAPEGH